MVDLEAEEQGEDEEQRDEEQEEGANKRQKL